MVRMCSARVSLMRSMMAASVDDLPEPVGPVTSTTPFFSAAVSAMAAGRFSSAMLEIFDAYRELKEKTGGRTSYETRQPCGQVHPGAGRHQREPHDV